ncbi:MAG TPA: SH3 domain-containing protein, partial [Phototrophicaceae bacterium]|nr:SH3 domain-containing protein [Phototrophicaceae bacterium]
GDVLVGVIGAVIVVYLVRLTNHSAEFTFFQANALHIYDPFQGTRFPFYNAPEETLYSPRFIQNGELILVNGDPSGQWRILRRDGNAVGTLPSTVTINAVAGVPDGFIYTTDTFTPGATTLVYVNTRDGLDAGIPVWTSASNAAPVIAWAGNTDTTAVTAQAALPAWAQLAEPIYAPGATPLPTPVSAQVSPGQLQNATPVVTSFLAVGRLATVNTTQGDQLNMRFGPGTSFEILGKLPAGVLVTLLDGPRFAEGLTWWKIRSSSGLEGWAVESVNDNGTQIQTLIPGP